MEGLFGTTTTSSSSSNTALTPASQVTVVHATHATVSGAKRTSGSGTPNPRDGDARSA